MAIVMSSEIGGYEYSFIDTPPDRLVCNICHFPSRNPYLTTCCGHVFCKSCLDDSKKYVSLKKVCPVCRQKKFVAYVNKQADREIRSFHVMCTNKERGCEWQGELNDINNHLGNSDGCQFEDVKCSNECGKMLQRPYLTSHVETECPHRKVDCQYCHIVGEHQFIEGEHQEQCPRFPLPCPNNCTSSYPHLVRGHKRRAHPYPREVIKYIPREDIEAHKEECPLQEVECSFKCGRMLQRQYLTKHIETDCPHRKVDCQYCHITGGYQFIEGEHKKQCPKLLLPCPNKCEIGSVLQEDMEAHRKECPLEIVQCEYHSVGCEERMVRKKKKEHEEEKVEEHLSLTKHSLTQTVTDTKSQLADTKSQFTDTKSQLASALEKINTLNLVLHQALGHTSCVLASDFVVTKWWTELTTLSMLMKSGSQICPVVVRITGYSEKKNNELRWFSDSFYSHDKGYKMCLCVEPAGDGGGKGTYLSVFLCVMKGPHDDEVTWPLRKKFLVKLLNQISDCEHHSKAVTYVDHAEDDTAARITTDNRARGWGYPQFISNEDLHKVTPTCQYLKDDCIFLQLS
ncbi:TNF receptor-associated factor 4-like [Dysidea avara]|uniref:TNF receptor-associated factor 4-like n=1 Tax=Dysidea avara TaxID=196820 RepID=UPI0033241944